MVTAALRTPEGIVNIYRSEAGRTDIRAWCTNALDQRLPSSHRRIVDSPLGPTHLTTVGTGPRDIVLLPGTNMNAGTMIPLIRALGTRFRVTVPDLPGQPGLSAAERSRGDFVDAFRAWLDHIRGTVSAGPVLVGESRGAAVALCASPSPQVAGLVLVSPAGFIRARVTPRILRASVPWLLRPTPARSARLLATMYGPEAVADHDHLVEWMTVSAQHSRSSLAPAPLPQTVIKEWRMTPCELLVGEHDPFFPAHRVRGPAATLLGATTTVVAGGGHLLSHTSPEAIVEATARVSGCMRIPDDQESQ